MERNPIILLPKSLGELQEITRLQQNTRAFTSCRRHKLPVAHSYVNMENFNNILHLSSQTVTCETAVELSLLIALLSQHCKMLPDISNSEHRTVGGFILSNACDAVLEVTFVTYSGKLLSLTPADPNFRYAVASAGMIGILYSCTLRIVEDDKRLLYQNRTYCRLPLDPIGWVSSGLARRICYNPYSSKCLMYDHSLENIYGPDREPFFEPYFKCFSGLSGGKIATAMHHHAEFLTPLYTDAFYKSCIGRSSGKAYSVLNMRGAKLARLKVQGLLEFECAVPICEAYSMLDKIHCLVMEWARQGYYLWLGLDLSFLGANNNPLSQAYQRDVISFTFPFVKSPEALEFIEELQELLGRRFHIGKYCPLSIREHHGWSEFDVARQLLDPTDKFSGMM